VTILYCKSTPELKLGPGSATDPTTIVFVNGWAEIPDGDARIQWVFAPGTPTIEVIDEEGRVEPGPETFTCDICGASFEAKRQLQGHKLSHRS